jgi:hypothetical protein
LKANRSNRFAHSFLSRQVDTTNVASAADFRLSNRLRQSFGAIQFRQIAPGLPDCVRYLATVLVHAIDFVFQPALHKLFHTVDAITTLYSQPFPLSLREGAKYVSPLHLRHVVLCGSDSRFGIRRRSSTTLSDDGANQSFLNVPPGSEYATSNLTRAECSPVRDRSLSPNI